MPEFESTDAVGHDGEPAETVGRVGRYVILERVGAGGVGIVFAAWDPVLSRRVALKLLRRHGAQDSELRLVREAQAMARLSHPNVVPVFDAGIVDGTAFVAMDFVDGGTLGAWMQEPHAQDEVIDLFLAAARGLAAAHSASLVHRDFKSDNVLLGRLPDGRLRAMVADFGLVRVGPETVEFDADLEAPVTPSGSGRLTTTGMIMGTPAYMAPEQFRGQGVDAKSDQFAFCIALFEALYGARPFAGGNVRALGFAVTHGQRAPIPAARNVPAAIARVIERGLAVDPSARHESMDALIDALVRARRRRRVGLLAAGLAPLVVAVAWIAAPDEGEPATPCADVDAPLRERWTDDARNTVIDAFVSTKLAYAREAADATVRSLDDWADAWIAARRDACEATAVRNEQSPALLDRRMVCLARGLTGFTAAVDVLRAPDRGIVERATSLASSLPDLRPCSDVAALLAPIPPPEPSQQAVVDELRAEVDRARASAKLLRSADACRALADLSTRAADAGYLPLRAEVELVRGVCEIDASQPGAAEILESALVFAIEAHDGGTASEAARHLAFVVGYRDGDADDGRRYVRLAHAHGAELSTPRSKARLALVAAQIEIGAGRYAAARDHIDRAREVGLPAFGERSAWASSLENTAGAIELRAGRYDAAQVAFERSLRIAEEAHGPHHPDVALPLNNLALAFERRARYEDAIAALERTHEVMAAAYGADDARVGQVLHNLGGVYSLSGDPKTAIQFLGQAIAVIGGAVGEEHVTVAGAWTMLGDALLERTQPVEARAAFDRALTIRERANGPDHPDLALALVGIARIDLAEGHVEAARNSVERALALVEERESDPVDRGALLEVHAAVLAASDRRDDALARAAEAERAFESAGPTATRRLAALRAWRDAL